LLSDWLGEVDGWERNYIILFKLFLSVVRRIVQ
jgi:hypothetical protein